MKKLFLILACLSGLSYVHGDVGDVTVINTISPQNYPNSFSFVVRSTNVFVSTQAFSKNLSSADFNLQHAMNTIDQLSITSGGGAASGISSYGTLYTSSASVSQSGITTTPVALNVFQSAGDSNLMVLTPASSQITVSTTAVFHIWANVISTGSGVFNQYFAIYVNGVNTGFTCQDTPSARCSFGGVKKLNQNDIIQIYTSVNSGSQSIMVRDAQLEVFAVGAVAAVPPLTDHFLLGGGGFFLLGSGGYFMLGN